MEFQTTTIPRQSEADRIRAVYARRKRPLDAIRYSPFDPAHQLLTFRANGTDAISPAEWNL